MLRRPLLNSDENTPPPSSRAKTTGFALVIALALMAFVLLLLLSMTTLVQVEARTANVQIKQIQARENAKLGILTALGALQKHAGQDQSVSAQAVILDADPATRATDGIEHPFWTGIWDVSEGTDDTDDSGYAQDYANWAMGLRESRATNAVWLIAATRASVQRIAVTCGRIRN